MREQRDLELLLLGATIASAAVSKTAFAASLELTEKDVAMVFEELKAGKPDLLKAWLKRRGVTVNGKSIEGVLSELESRTKRRRLSGLANRLTLALAAGCEEEVKSCLEGLTKEPQ